MASMWNGKIKQGDEVKAGYYMLQGNIWIQISPKNPITGQSWHQGWKPVSRGME